MSGTEGPEFLTIRLVAMILSWTMLALNAFVVYWWMTTSVAAVRSSGQIHRSDQLMFAIAIISITTFVMSLLRLKLHYLLGLGDHARATIWSGEQLPTLMIFVGLQLVGYALYVKFAWTDYTKMLFLAGIFFWVILGLVLFFQLGGFSFTYVNEFSDDRLNYVECLP